MAAIDTLSIEPIVAGLHSLFLEWVLELALVGQRQNARASANYHDKVATGDALASDDTQENPVGIWWACIRRSSMRLMS